jgi:molybdate transport system permease protein
VTADRNAPGGADSPPYRPPSDVPLFIGLGIISGAYILLITALLAADAFYTSLGDIGRTLQEPTVRYSIMLSLVSCSVTALLSVIVAVPTGYLLSRHLGPANQNISPNAPGWPRAKRVGMAAFNGFVDTILDIPIVLPPLVIGLSLLILFRHMPEFIERNVTYAIPAVILAQFTVACAFAVRTMRVTFDQISPRCEQVALTLGCSRGQAFWRVVIPEAQRGILAAGTLAWARALGEFGPILVFAGTTQMRTEVLSTTVFLELSIGHIEVAVAVSLLMVLAALMVLLVTRFLGLRNTFTKAVVVG